MPKREACLRFFFWGLGGVAAGIECAGRDGGGADLSDAPRVMIVVRCGGGGNDMRRVDAANI